MEKEMLMKAAVSEEEAFVRLCGIIRLLRRECPWDREQTHESLKGCLMEEAYELLDAISLGDMENMREELGDVMLQVIFHSTMCQDDGQFSLSDVINDECEKMIRRHPHIFNDETTKTVDKVLEKWDNVKRDEKGYTSYTDEIMSVPRSMPALLRSCKIQKKAAGCGFDWDDVSGAMDKITEELEEVKEAALSEDRDSLAMEVGDLLFSVVNVSRGLGVDPELALAMSADKFAGRFAKMEALAADRNLRLDDMTLQEMDLLWDEVKAGE